MTTTVELVLVLANTLQVLGLAVIAVAQRGVKTELAAHRELCPPPPPKV